MSKSKSKQRQIKKHNARILHLWGHDFINAIIVGEIDTINLRELTREGLPPNAIRIYEVDDGPPIYAPDGTKIVY